MNASPVHYAETTGMWGQLNTTSPFMVLPDLSHKIGTPCCEHFVLFSHCK